MIMDIDGVYDNDEAENNIWKGYGEGWQGRKMDKFNKVNLTIYAKSEVNSPWLWRNLVNC